MITRGKQVVDNKGDTWLQVNYKLPKTQTEIATTYIKLVNSFSNLGLWDGEIRFLAYVATKNNTVSGTCKINYINEYKVSKAVLDNTISKLKKKKLLVKENNVITLHPDLCIDFANNKNFMFTFRLCQKVKE